jgi:hypothetical protein
MDDDIKNNDVTIDRAARDVMSGIELVLALTNHQLSVGRQPECIDASQGASSPISSWWANRQAAHALQVSGSRRAGPFRTMSGVQHAIANTFMVEAIRSRRISVFPLQGTSLARRARRSVATALRAGCRRAHSRSRRSPNEELAMALRVDDARAGREFLRTAYRP